MSYEAGNSKLAFTTRSNPGLFRDGAVAFAAKIGNQMSVSPDGPTNAPAPVV